jgi:hypothetical protein
VSSVIDRIPLAEKVAVWLNKSSDFMWQPTSALPELSVFTHRTCCCCAVRRCWMTTKTMARMQSTLAVRVVMGPLLYLGPFPVGFQPQNSSFYDPALPNVTADNVGIISDVALMVMQLLAVRTETDNVMWPIGGDFYFQDGAAVVCRRRIVVQRVLSPTAVVSWR